MSQSDLLAVGKGVLRELGNTGPGCIDVKSCNARGGILVSFDRRHANAA